MKNKRKIGFEHEKIVGEYLEKRGYEILEYNFYSRHGEIDIVAKHDGYLVFVEVKYRENDRKGHPLEAISVSKQKAICKCAMYYMKKKHLYNVPIRFDAVGVLGNKIQVVKNAFDYVG